ARPDRASGPVHRGDGGGARRADRRDHRLDVPAAALRLAAARPDRAAAQGRERAGRARGQRHAVRGDCVVEAHAATHHHGPPAAHASSRVNREILGMFLFIASEIMLFGAFFTAYFFVRVVNGVPWHHGSPFHLPVFFAFVNTCILVTSSFTIHWALQSIKRGNHAGL